MVKASGRSLTVKFIPLWLFSTLLVVLIDPLFQPANSALIPLLIPAEPEILSSPITYMVEPAEERDAALYLAGPGQRLLPVSSYHGQENPVEFAAEWPDLLAFTFFWSASVQTDMPAITDEDSAFLWQPAFDGLKQAVVYQDGMGFVDTAVTQAQSQLEMNFESVTAGLRTVPSNMFGYLYLNLTDVPDPVEVSGIDSRSIRISRFDGASEQLLKEMWAVNHQQWLYTPAWLYLASGFLVVLPFFILRSVRLLYLWAALLMGAEAVSFYLLSDHFKWLMPVCPPLISVFLAVLAVRRHQFQLRQLALADTRFTAVSEQWIGHLLDENKPDAAFRYLKENAVHLSSTRAWMQVADSFSLNREYEKSAEVCRDLLMIDSSNADARNKIEQLNGILDKTQTQAVAAMAAELPIGQGEDLRLGRYEVLEELGRGAMGIVYAALDPKINRKVALKVVSLKSLGIEEGDQVKQRFFREAQAAGKLSHPNIVTVYDVGEEHDVAYIAMDLLTGFSLAEHLKQRSAIDIRSSVEWARQAAEALAYAHESSVIHRDVKPANMILEEGSQRLKLSDFGVARIDGLNQTQTGIVLGSPSYMSPEQIQGKPLTGATDIFSLGVTLYQCLTGVLPFTGETLPALAYSITQTKQKSPRALNDQVPLSLVRIVNRSLQKNIHERYESAQQMADALSKWLQEHP